MMMVKKKITMCSGKSDYFILTCAHDFIYGDTGGIQLFGEFVHSLAGVLVRVRVHVGSDTWKMYCSGSREWDLLVNKICDDSVSSVQITVTFK